MNLAALPSRARVVEVGPRDGLQNESAILTTRQKAEFVRLLARAGFDEIEVASFVNPARVPQMADAEELFSALGELLPEPPRLTALVPNRRGLERAAAAGVRSIAFFTAASETFNERNIGMSIARSLEQFEEMMPDARSLGMRVRAYVSTAFHCPYEGRIPPARVAPIVQRLVEMGVDEVSVGDTIGHAVPTEVAQLTEELLPVLPKERFACHFHDTRGFALANTLMALQCGISIFDSSAGGVGGCPFAPGAAGNVATEDLLGLLQGMGIETGIDLPTVAEASRYLASLLNRPLPSRYLQSLGGGAECA